MFKGILTFIFASVPLIATVAQARCNCAENFEFVYAKIKVNYAGWMDKTAPDPTGFEKFTDQQRQKAKAESQKHYCYKIIQDWLLYFQDHHTHLFDETPALSFEGQSPAEIREYFSQSEQIDVTENKFIETFHSTSDIEGIWQMEGGNYRVAILKSKTAHRDFAGVILKADSVYWVPGQIKMELSEAEPENFSTMFYMRDHSLRMVRGTLYQNELRFDGLNTFKKVFPQPSETNFSKPVETLSYKTELRKIDKSTLYLRLPTFNHQVKVLVDSVLQANHDLITETRNLIIDVRDNGGGSDVTYADVIQYLYTNKIKLVNNSIWSSEDNIQKFRNILNDPEYPASGKEYIQELIKKLEAKPNTFVRKEDNVIKKKNGLPIPRNVVILINRHCASSCEEFVLAARQSKKVTLMGENTMGVLDYANVHHLNLPCTGWGLQYATSRTNRLPEFPIDNIGIAPTVKIPEGEDWMGFVLEWLKKN